MSRGDDHSADEWLDTTSIGARVALLAGVLIRLATADGTDERRHRD